MTPLQIKRARDVLNLRSRTEGDKVSRMMAFNALAAYVRHKNWRNRQAVILALAWGLCGNFNSGALARAETWLDDAEESQP